jgi:hypothetical protein
MADNPSHALAVLDAAEVAFVEARAVEDLTWLRAITEGLRARLDRLEAEHVDDSEPGGVALVDEGFEFAMTTGRRLLQIVGMLDEFSHRLWLQNGHLTRQLLAVARELEHEKQRNRPPG